jgi:hypothetical protein
MLSVRSLAGQPVDGDAAFERGAAFLFQSLALARCQRFEEIGVGGIAVIDKMELLVGPVQKTCLFERGDFVFRQERHMRRRGLMTAGEFLQTGGKRIAHGGFIGRGGAQQLGPVAGVKGTEHCSFG